MIGLLVWSLWDVASRAVPEWAVGIQQQRLILVHLGGDYREDLNWGEALVIS